MSAKGAGETLENLLAQQSELVAQFSELEGEKPAGVRRRVELVREKRDIRSALGALDIEIDLARAELAQADDKARVRAVARLRKREHEAIVAIIDAIRSLDQAMAARDEINAEIVALDHREWWAVEPWFHEIRGPLTKILTQDSGVHPELFGLEPPVDPGPQVVNPPKPKTVRERFSLRPNPDLGPALEQKRREMKELVGGGSG